MYKNRNILLYIATIIGTFQTAIGMDLNKQNDFITFFGHITKDAFGPSCPKENYFAILLKKKNGSLVLPQESDLAPLAVKAQCENIGTDVYLATGIKKLITSQDTMLWYPIAADDGKFTDFMLQNIVPSATVGIIERTWVANVTTILNNTDVVPKKPEDCKEKIYCATDLENASDKKIEKNEKLDMLIKNSKTDSAKQDDHDDLVLEIDGKATTGKGEKIHSIHVPRGCAQSLSSVHHITIDEFTYYTIDSGNVNLENLPRIFIGTVWQDKSGETVIAFKQEGETETLGDLYTQDTLSKIIHSHKKTASSTSTSSISQNNYPSSNTSSNTSTITTNSSSSSLKIGAISLLGGLGAYTLYNWLKKSDNKK